MGALWPRGGRLGLGADAEDGVHLLEAHVVLARRLPLVAEGDGSLSSERVNNLW